MLNPSQTQNATITPEEVVTKIHQIYEMVVQLQGSSISLASN